MANNIEIIKKVRDDLKTWTTNNLLYLEKEIANSGLGASSNNPDVENTLVQKVTLTDEQLAEGLHENITYAENTSAFGISTVAGSMGYRIIGVTALDGSLAINDQPGYYYVEATNNIPDIIVGESYSIYLQSNADNHGKIISVDDATKRIEVDKLFITETISTALQNNDSESLNTYYSSAYIKFSTYPEIGEFVIGIGSSAEGYQTKALAMGAHAEGYLTTASGKYSHAEGRETFAGYAAHAEGRNTKALGLDSHAEGSNTTAYDQATHTEGQNTKAYKKASHAEGIATTADGQGAHSEGNYSEALNSGAHAEGYRTKVYGKYGHAEGRRSEVGDPNDLSLGEGAHAEGGIVDGDYNDGIRHIATGKFSHIEGSGTNASALAAHAEGRYTEASGKGAHAEGYKTKALHSGSHSSGRYTQTSRDYQTVVGEYNKDNENAYFIVGNGTSTTDRNNALEVLVDGNVIINTPEYTNIPNNGLISKEQFENNLNTAINNIQQDITDNNTTINNQIIDLTAYSNLKKTDIGGYTTRTGSNIANAQYAFSEGRNTKAYSEASHTEGRETIAGTEANGGKYAHAEGYRTTASGEASHAEGRYGKATKQSSHVEGGITNTDNNNGVIHEASGSFSHTEGEGNVASGEAAHAEGKYTISSGTASHSEGYKTKATAMGSHASGRYAEATESYQTVIGDCPETITDSMFIVGNGSVKNSQVTRSNAFGVMRDGTAFVGADPINAMDVATKNYVDTKTPKIVDEEGNSYNIKVVKSMPAEIKDNEIYFDISSGSIGQLTNNLDFWNSETSYKSNDIVSYDKGLFKATANNKNTIPTNVDNWMQLTLTTSDVMNMISSQFTEIAQDLDKLNNGGIE